jgi:hypothetical protein
MFSRHPGEVGAHRGGRAGRGACGVSKPTTKAAQSTLAWLKAERDFWAATADEDELNSFVRHGAISRRDQLDMLLQRMPAELAAVEDEAASEDARVDALLDLVA